MSKRRRLAAALTLTALFFTLAATTPQAQAATTEFGLTPADSTRTSGTTSSNIVGSEFACPTAGTAQSISADITFTPINSKFGNDNTGNNADSIMNKIKGGKFPTLGYAVIAQNIEARIKNMGSPKNMKAAIYSSPTTGDPELIATTEQVPVASGTAWVTFNFLDPQPTLTKNTDYLLVVWSAFIAGDENAYLQYSSSIGGNGVYTDSLTYGDWPLSQSFGANYYQYSIRCNYVSAPLTIKAAIYDSSNNFVRTTEEKTFSTATDSWVTFNFENPKQLKAANYILVIWSSGASLAKIWYTTGTSNQGHTFSPGSYGNWPETPSFIHDSKKYNIYCTIQSSYAISATAGTGGSISPSGSIEVNHGTDQTFTITPDTGYIISDVSVDGSSVGIPDSYTFTSVTADHTISASFNDPIFASPEFPFGALLSLAACIAAFIAFKKPMFRQKKK